MVTAFFDFNLDNWGIILLILFPALINLGIFLYGIIFLNSNRTNTSFSAFVLLLAFWQLCEGFTRLSLSPEIALEWYRIAGAPSLFMLPFGMLFILRFTGWYRKTHSPLLYSFLFIPAIIFEMIVTARVDTYTVINSNIWNWIIKPDQTPINMIMYLWMAFTSLFIVVLCWLYYFKSKKGNEIKRTQSLLIAIGFTIPILGGIIAEVVIPLFFRANPLPISVSLMTIFSVLSFIAIVKYNFTDYSPRHQWDVIVETLNEGVLIVDNMDRIMYVNKKFCEVMEYKPSDLKGKVANVLFSDNTPKNLIESAITERNNDISGNYEIQLKTKSGEKIWMLISGFPYLDKNERVVGAIGIHTNINHIKQTTAKLEEKIVELRQFFYKAQHDLKTPATTIQGLINLFKEKKEKNAEHLLSLIEKCNYQLLMVIDNISRIEAIMRHNPDVKEIDLENKIKRIIQYISPEDKRIEFKINLSLDSHIHSDKELLNIILRNILDNTTKFSDPKKPTCQTEINCERKNGIVEIRITDNGQGIPERIQDKVFNIFFKGNKSSGIGLGLYMAKCAAEKLGGSISMKSKEHLGTEFIICLPNHN
jgi:PAS domain S-box-containing protein